MILRCEEVDEMKVQDEPAGGEVIVEEGDGDGEDDEVGNEEQEHADVPIKSQREREMWKQKIKS